MIRLVCWNNLHRHVRILDHRVGRAEADVGLAGEDRLDRELLAIEEGELVIEPLLAGAREADQEEQGLDLGQVGQRDVDRLRVLGLRHRRRQGGRGKRRGPGHEYGPYFQVHRCLPIGFVCPGARGVFWARSPDDSPHPWHQQPRDRATGGRRYQGASPSRRARWLRSGAARGSEKRMAEARSTFRLRGLLYFREAARCRRLGDRTLARPLPRRCQDGASGMRRRSA